MRRYVLAGAATAERGAQALEDLIGLDVVLHPHDPLLGVMWRLRDNLTMYDAAYVALAFALDVPLVTLDARIAAAPGLEITVDLIT